MLAPISATKVETVSSSIPGIVSQSSTTVCKGLFRGYGWGFHRRAWGGHLRRRRALRRSGPRPTWIIKRRISVNLGTFRARLQGLSVILPPFWRA
jgi:hypothetical protein